MLAATYLLFLVFGTGQGQFYLPTLVSAYEVHLISDSDYHEEPIGCSGWLDVLVALETKMRQVGEAVLQQFRTRGCPKKKGPRSGGKTRCRM